MRTTRAVFPVVTLLILISACSGPTSTVLVATEDTPLLPTPAVVEDFDPRPYREVPPPVHAEIRHDAPESLLLGKADKGQRQMRKGYRIQLLSTRSKEEADQMSAQAIQWWGEERKKGNLAWVLSGVNGVPPVYQDFSEPYWRVRLGNFVAREAAQQALEAVREHFGGAFIAPSEVRLR